MDYLVRDEVQRGLFVGPHAIMVNLPNAARFAFGHGLTYGRITYSDFAATPATLAQGGTIRISAKVTNTGAHAAEEVAQLYIHDVAASITRPVRQLKGYRKVKLAPGESRDVIFELTRADLTFFGPDLTKTVEPGLFKAWVAPDAQADGVSGSFILAAD